jgi:hypothetical protein
MAEKSRYGDLEQTIKEIKKEAIKRMQVEQVAVLWERIKKVRGVLLCLREYVRK